MGALVGGVWQRRLRHLPLNAAAAIAAVASAVVKSLSPVTFFWTSDVSTLSASVQTLRKVLTD